MAVVNGAGTYVHKSVLCEVVHMKHTSIGHVVFCEFTREQHDGDPLPPPGPPAGTNNGESGGGVAGSNGGGNGGGRGNRSDGDKAGNGGNGGGGAAKSQQ